MKFSHQALKLQNVTRFHMCDLVRPQNVAEHSFNVAMIAFECALWVFRHASTFTCEHERARAEQTIPYRVLFAALYHDVMETLVGDIDYWVKNTSLDFHSAWLRMEEEREKKFLSSLPSYIREEIETVRKLSLFEHKLVKTADYLELGHYVLGEARRGNRTGAVIAGGVFENVLAKYWDTIFDYEECPYFQMLASLKKEYNYYKEVCGE